MNRKKRKGLSAAAIRCPYCGSPAILRSADGIYHDNSRGMQLYVCRDYLRCDSYVRVHEGTKMPVGTMANGELRALRTRAHHSFDRLYKSRYMSKESAYEWMAGMLGLPLSQAHIGYMGECYCKKVIEESDKLLSQMRKKNSYKKSKEKKEMRVCN